MKATPKTKVVFRIHQGEVLALFPYEPGTRDSWTCSCYAHMGQHSTASVSCVMNHSTPAKPEQYADLEKELIEIGYDLVILKRINYTSAWNARKKELQRD
jgi:aspartate carbamoyltransferase catalytic subunit